MKKSDVLINVTVGCLVMMLIGGFVGGIGGFGFATIVGGVIFMWIANNYGEIAEGFKEDYIKATAPIPVENKADGKPHLTVVK